VTEDTTHLLPHFSKNLMPHAHIMAKHYPRTADQKNIYNDQRNAKRKVQGDEYRTKEMEHAKKRRASSTADDRAKERACGKMRRVGERAKQAGLKQAGIDLSPCVLQAVEIHDLVCDEKNNFIAPLKLPDMCVGALRYPPDIGDRTEQEKCNWFTNNLKTSKTFRTGCRHYLNGFLYEDLDESKWFVVEDGNLVINVRVQQADGSMKEEETQVKVLNLPSLLCDVQNSLFKFGEAVSTCEPHVRANSGDMGAILPTLIVHTIN
jgi:hypothetical protein